MELIKITLSHSAFVLVSLLWIWAASKLANAYERKHYDANEQIEHGTNVALAFRRCGLYLGTGIALLGPLLGPTRDFYADLYAMVWEGAIVTVFMFVSGILNDKFILHHVCNTDEVRKENAAVGIVECGGYVATGLIALGSFAGDGTLLGAIGFFALGQLALIVAARIYERCAGYDAIALICDRNRAAATMLATVLVSLGIILKSCIMGPSRGWVNDMLDFGFYAAFGVAMLIIVEKLFDWKFLPNTKIPDLVKSGNLAAIIVTAGAMLSSAFLISVAVL